MNYRAELALKDLDAEWGRQYPGVIDACRRAWNKFMPFLDYPTELRRIVYTTNAIESIKLPTEEDYQNSQPFPVRRSSNEAPPLPRTAKHFQQERR
jgi:putative transposase